MRNCTVLLVSIALGVLLSASPAFANAVQVPEPSSLLLAGVGIGAVGLYLFVKRKR